MISIPRLQDLTRSESLLALDRILRHLNDYSGKLLLNVHENQSLAAGTAVDVSDAVVIPVQGSGGAVTSTAAPTIRDGVNGQVIALVGRDSTNTYTVQDQNTLANSNVQLQAISRQLGKGDLLFLWYLDVVGDWSEIVFYGGYDF